LLLYFYSEISLSLRKVFSGYYGHTFHPVGEIGPIEDVAKEYGQHLGKDSFFDIEPNDLD